MTVLIVLACILLALFLLRCVLTFIGAVLVAAGALKVNKHMSSRRRSR